MINLSTNTKQLDIILPNTNKALAEVIKNATPKELEILSQNKDLKSVMNSLLKQTTQNPNSDKTLLNLVKNNPTLKNLGSVSQSIKDLLGSIKSNNNLLPVEKQLKSFLLDIKQLNEPILKQKLENSGIFLESRLKNAQNPQVELKSLLESLTKILGKSKIFNVGVLNNQLKEVLSSKLLSQASNTALLLAQDDNPKELAEVSKKIQNVLNKLQEHQSSSTNKNDVINSKDLITHIHKLSTLSSKTQLSSHNNIKEIISNDLKAIVYQASEEIIKSEHPNKTELLKHIDKLALQIDYHQLVSHLSNSSSLYIPFSWEQLQEGHIELKHDKENRFYCDIDLKLKEYGELNIKLTLYDENQLNLHIYSNNTMFKELIKKNISSLRSSLIESQITPREIRLFDSIKKSEPSPYESNDKPIDLGFEVKV